MFSCNPNKSGISIFWNDEKLIIEPYNKKQKHYYCGKELLKFPHTKALIYQILVVDYDECCFAKIYTDGEIKIKWKEHSSIPHKHKKGGQSAPRFARIRDTEITLWFKRIDEYLKKETGEIYLGMSKIYYKRFYKTLSTYNQQKIKERLSCEYSGLTGIYQMINLLEKKKN